MLANGVAFHLTLLLALSFGAQAADNYPDCGPQTLKNYELLGPVHSVRVEVAGADGGARSVIETYIFDRAGRLLEDRHPIAVSPDDATVFQVFRNVYAPTGRDYEIDGFEVDDDKGGKPKDLHRHLVKFDRAGRCAEEADVDSDGSLDLEKTYEYDGESNLINEVSHDADGRVSSVAYTYAQKHQLLSQKEIGWTTNYSRAYRYDAQGNRTDEFVYTSGALETHRVFQYDGRNRLISLAVFVDPAKDAHAYGRCNDCGPSSGKTIFTRDDVTGTIKEEIFDSDNKLVSTRYESDATHSRSNDELYDSHDNWIRRKSDKAESSYIYRVIEYY